MRTCVAIIKDGRPLIVIIGQQREKSLYEAQMYCTLDCAGRHHDTAHRQIKNQKMRCWTGSDPPSSPAHLTFI